MLNVKHAFQSAKTDGTDPTQIQPSHWNSAHEITAAAKTLVGRPDQSAGAVKEITVGTGLALSDGGALSIDGQVVPRLLLNPLTGRNVLTNGTVNVSRPWEVAAKTRGNVGARCVALVNTPSFALSATTYTWSLAIAIPADAIAVQIITINGQAATVAGVTGAVSVGSTKTDMLNNAGTWKNATWAGSSTVGFATATANAPLFNISDWIPITPAASTFSSSAGLPLQMCYARIMTPSSNTSVTLAGYTASSAAWETIADNNVRGVRFQAGDFVASPSGMTGSSNPQNAPVVGIQYMTKSSNVVHVMLLGDSIEYGFGPTIAGNSWGHIACNALSTTGRIYSCNNQGYSGQTTSQILTRAITVIPLFKPQIVIFPAFSPNDGTPTQAIIDTQIYNIRRITDLCLSNGALPIILQGFPKTTDVNNTTSSYTAPQDAFRTELNALSATGAVVYVPHTLGNGASPELWGSSTYQIDGTHPGDVGAAIVAPLTQSAITNAGF
jgi:lysophospholipase L1-like esterase